MDSSTRIVSRARAGALVAALLASGCVIPLSVGDGPGGEGTGGGGSDGSGASSSGSGGSDAPSSTGAIDGSSGSGSGGASPVLELGFSQVKQLDFSWTAVAGAEHYRLLEAVGPGEPFVQLGGDIVGEAASFTMPLHLRHEASYVLQACEGGACEDVATAGVTDGLVDSIGYFKASNAGGAFGIVALSGDGNTLAVGAPGEDGGATGIGGDQTDDSAEDAGAVYVFVRDGAGQWSQQAYIKASNTDAGDGFGRAVGLSDDGTTLAVGAPREASCATGVGGDQGDDGCEWAGAVYAFVRDGSSQWSQQAYIKASNTHVPIEDGDDWFGNVVALSADGNTLVVGSEGEDGQAVGIDGDEQDQVDWNGGRGAVYAFARDATGQWSQQAYIKGSEGARAFGKSVALSQAGSALAVGAPYEDLPGGPSAAGVVYMFERNAAGQWSQHPSLTAPVPGYSDRFGTSVALSGDGLVLAVGATKLDPQRPDWDDQVEYGAVYMLVRDGVGRWSHRDTIHRPRDTSKKYDEGGFGDSLALSADGGVLAIASPYDESGAVGVGSNSADGAAMDSGAVFVYVRDEDDQWLQQSYVKASNADGEDHFGWSVALNGEGTTLAVGAIGEGSSATGIGGDQTDDSAYAGAVYVY